MILPEVITGKCILTGAFQEWGINDPTARHSKLKKQTAHGHLLDQSLQFQQQILRTTSWHQL
ncbi:MAG: hypothetical protein CM15mP49_13320 [Actinomycetota bacterium]|nr:MAG: hypothetical protein CM15mP49_13320 [Actinomycetota bacterium]